MKYNTIKNIYTTLILSVGRKEKEEQHPLATPLAKDYGGEISL